MDTLIVYIDDADYATRQLTPMLNGLEAMHCILVGCPPRLNRHAGQWVSKEAHKRWRQEWGEKVLTDIAREVGQRGNTVSTRVAHDRLVNVTRQLRGQFGGARVFDARRPKLGHPLEPVTQDQPSQDPPSPWLVVGSAMALGAAVSSVVE